MNKFTKFMDNFVEIVSLLIAVPIMLVCLAMMVCILPFYIPVYVYKKNRGLLDKEAQ